MANPLDVLTSGLVRLTTEQGDFLRHLLDAGDRAGFYLVPTGSGCAEPDNSDT